MDLLDRYLAAIGRRLPAAQRADITAELRDVLMSQVEDREAELRRPLNRQELEGLLVAFGHPLVVAGRYRRVQYLIGPEMFPFWWAGVKTALAFAVGIYLVVALIAIVAADGGRLPRASLPSFEIVLLLTFGVVTLVCALIEHLGLTRVLTRWKPGQLPSARGKPRSRFEAGMDIGMDVVMILWWQGVIQFRHLVPIPSFLTVELGPVFAAWHMPILAYLVGDLAVSLVAMARPGLTQLNAGLSLARSLVGAGLCLALLQAGHWVAISSASPDMAPGALAQIQANFDLALKIGLTVTVAGLLVKAGIEAWRLWEAREAGRAPVRA